MTTQASQPARPGEIQIDPSQLRPGVHVRLPGAWMDHPFALNSFVISTHEEAKIVAALKLPSIYCNLSKCRIPPVKKDEAPVMTPEQAEEVARLAALQEAQMEEKRKRAAVMAELRGRIEKARKHYQGARSEVTAAFKNFDANPKESVRQVASVSEDSVSALLADPDSAIVLIAEKGQSDGHATHAMSVMTLSLLLGKQARLPEEALTSLGIGALLHDIGKNQINPSILKNLERNKFEEAIYQEHCMHGVKSAAKSGCLSKPILDVILHHHEHMDGSGYPDKLSGESIHLASRIVGIADRFDCLTNPIDYKVAMSPSEALARMWAKEKKNYDAQLLQLFIRAMGIHPPGSIVQLSDGRVGAVVSTAKTESPLSPQVMLYEPDIPRSEAIIVDLAKDTSITIDKSLRLQERPSDELDYLLPRRKMNWFAGG